MSTLADTRADLLRALGVFAEPPGPQHARLAGLLGLPQPAGTAWTEAFTVQLVPHAAIYLGPEGMLGGEAADRVAGFWRALHLPVPGDPDHLTTLLGLHASLVEAHATHPDTARRALLGNARTALLHEHLLCWLPPYAHAMRQVGPPPYAAWAELLEQALRDEATRIGAPERLPLHLRAVPPPPHAYTDVNTMLDFLLSPARSGVILTRGHLAALARDADLGLRIGDRRRVLRALLDQDPTTTLHLLADQADQWAARHHDDDATTGPIATHWARRATATAHLLRTAASKGQATDDHRPTRH